jgi:apolipoprotein D and lipocalin family protein
MVGGAMLVAIVKLSTRVRRPMTVATSVDLARYAGKWYEIARLPNRFQGKCAGDTTATYSLHSDGSVSVLNQCRRFDGRSQSIRGTAQMADSAGTTSKSKVSFFWPFTGDYWILDVAPDYQWALVGEPDRKYLWILSREPRLDERTIDRLLDHARQEGYDVSRLLRTPQTHNEPVARLVP